VISVADSGPRSRDLFRVYMLRLSTLIPKGPQQYSLGWKQSGRGAADGKRPEEGTPAFAEMADPGAAFEGAWHENEFLNREEVRQALRWSAPVTREQLFEAANRYAEKQLEVHAQYAGWTGLAGLGASVAELQARLAAVRGDGGCLLSIGWGAGFLSKSAVIETDAIKSGLPFPKTRRVVFLKNKPATLPGWVELRVD
jgi:CRISPR-associated protein Csm5